MILSIFANEAQILLANGLVKEGESGLEIGKGSTHLGSDSELVSRHHVNWRLRAIRELETESRAESNLHYTGPMTLSKTLSDEIRKSLVQWVSKSSDRIQKSKSEKLMCLNIDWFSWRQ